MNLTRKMMPIFAAIGMAAAAPAAFADEITLDPSNIGQSYSFNFDGFSSGTTISGLTSSATFTLTGVSSNSYTFNYSLTNTSTNPIDSRVSSFAFNTDPNIASATSTGAFSYATVGSSYPNGIGSIDVCFKDAATGSCAGGGSGGLTDGQTGTGSLTLNFSQPLTSLTLSDFYVRYQSISGAGNVTSASGAGTLTGSTTTGGTSVPEPGMLGLLGGAAAALVIMRRRRTVRKAPALAAA